MHYRTYIMFNNRPPGWWNGSNHGTGSFRLVATQTSLLACTIGQIKNALPTSAPSTRGSMNPIVSRSDAHDPQ